MIMKDSGNDRRLEAVWTRFISDWTGPDLLFEVRANDLLNGEMLRYSQRWRGQMIRVYGGKDVAGGGVLANDLLSGPMRQR